MSNRPKLLLPTGLLVGTLGLSTLAVQAVGAIQGRQPAIAAHGPDAPAWLSVPTAGIEEQVIDAQGLTAQGVIDPDQGEAIWYSGTNRAVPGQLGTAVIAAHMVYYEEPDVFADLGEVTEGDIVTIGYRNGSTREFVITDTMQLSKKGTQTSPEVWDDQQDVARIALITCDDSLGERADGHRNANFVAIAEALEE
ncbi:class F sortase [Ornithinimicrobium sp. Y1847]|uniref:class F sortase n=1 Tax=unclassified Ornithinimicrobium TaxID=2615080 RepID=UPI003B68146B